VEGGITMRENGRGKCRHNMRNNKRADTSPERWGKGKRGGLYFCPVGAAISLSSSACTVPTQSKSEFDRPGAKVEDIG